MFTGVVLAFLHEADGYLFGFGHGQYRAVHLFERLENLVGDCLGGVLFDLTAGFAKIGHNRQLVDEMLLLAENRLDRNIVGLLDRLELRSRELDELPGEALTLLRLEEKLFGVDGGAAWHGFLLG
ncbi:MAG: hypothetical protein WBW88_13630 [Rhodothermales bacterium]